MYQNLNLKWFQRASEQNILYFLSILAQPKAFSSAELMSPSVIHYLSFCPSVPPSVNKAQIMTTGDIRLKSNMACPRIKFSIKTKAFCGMLIALQ